MSFAKYLHANEDNGRPAVSSWQRDLLLAVVDWHFNRINCSVNESRAPYCFRWLSLDLMAQLSVGQNRSLTRPSFWGLKACSEPAATATKKKKKRRNVVSCHISALKFSKLTFYLCRVFNFIYVTTAPTAPGHGAWHPAIQPGYKPARNVEQWKGYLPSVADTLTANTLECANFLSSV